MSIRVQDPLFLLSAQTGLSVGELAASAAEGNPDINRPQEALKTGEPIPVIFCRRRNSNGGVMIQPKMSEGSFANPLIEDTITLDNGVTLVKTPVQVTRIKYLLVLSEGNLPQLQVRDLFHGGCRRGTYNQAYNARAGTWDPGNFVDDHFDYIVQKNSNGVFDFNPYTDLSTGQSARVANTIYYRNSDGVYYINIKYIEHVFPTFCGTSGTYSGLTTLSFEYEEQQSDTDKINKGISAFVRGGLQVTRLVDGTTGPSDNYADLTKYLFQANNRLADDLIDNASLTIAANFTDANSFLFNGQITESQNLSDWLQRTSVNFLLRLSNSGGKFGLTPRLPYNTDYTIKTTQVSYEFCFTEDHIVDGGFEIEYISLEDREPVCFEVYWRQQPEADFGLVRTVQVRYTGEATNGPFVSIDMSNYCTSENHAVKVGAFRLAQRKFITHHLRLTVRERSYNATLVVGDLVRVRLRRETNEGDAQYHDKLYEINMIEKSFEGAIAYDLTHFPIDSQGRSLVAREVADAVGAGNTINVGRSTFSCDENSATATTLVGSSSGGGGSNQPGGNDTEVELDPPSDGGGSGSDNPYPGDFNDENEDDSSDDGLTDTLPQPQITGYTDTPTAGDTLSIDPGCSNALIKWYKVDINTGQVTKISEGVGGSLTVTQALQQEGVRVYAEGCCPDPASISGYSACRKSNVVDVFDEIVDCPGGGASGAQGTFTKVINVGTAFPASFTFTYTAYSIQDRFVISGAATLDTGYVSGTNVDVTVQKTSSDPYITVTVYAPTSGTLWNYSVGCAS